jgi:hypothetical protein
MTFDIRRVIAELDEEGARWLMLGEDYTVREYEYHEDTVLEFAAEAESWIRAALEVLTPEQIALVDGRVSARVSQLQAGCEYPGDNHSGDVVLVYHGDVEPITLCGYHASQTGPALYETIRTHRLAAHSTPLDAIPTDMEED